MSRNKAKTNMGLVEVHASTCTNTFILCNSARNQASMVADLKGCAEVTKIKVSNERYCHQAKLNLISLSAMLNRDWLLEGNKNELILKREGNKNELILKREDNQRKILNI